MLPIYARPQAAHAAYFANVAEAEARRWAVLGEEALAECLRRQARRDPPGWYPWRYNDVRAWLCVYIERGIVHVAIHERSGRGQFPRRSTFHLRDESAAKVYGLGKSSTECSKEIEQSIVSAVEQMGIEPYGFDQRAFRQVLSAVDWKLLIARSTRSGGRGRRAGRTT